MELSEALKNLGFTQQEATLYIKLCQHESMTGYEAAKTSGISRSNAYASLSNLVDKGYAYTIDGNPLHYVAVTKDDLLANARRDFERTIQIIDDKLITAPLVNEPYITVIGEKAILDKMTNIIEQASERIYISVNAAILHQLVSPLTEACKRQLKVVILSSEDISECDHIYYETERNTSIKIIADTKEILAGTLSQSLYSKNKTLVNIIRESMLDEITLITERKQ